MSSDISNNSSRKDPPGKHPIRKAVLRGLGVVSPPLFTILIFVWVIGITDEYLLTPATNVVRDLIVWNLSDEIRTEQAPEDRAAEGTGRKPSYYRVANDKYVPAYVYERVKANPGDLAPLEVTTAKEIYRRYVRLEYLSPWKTVPFFLAVFIIVLYLLGKFMAAGIGRFFWGRFEQVIHRLPLVRNVYSSVKQVSDFLFTEREIEYTRVVAVQYPRRGIYSLGLVTGDSMKDIRDAAGEPVMSVLMPTSPMPVTGFTISVRKSETIDLNITIDQAFQFIISCGVVVPTHQVWSMKAKPGELPAPSKPDETTELATRQ